MSDKTDPKKTAEENIEKEIKRAEKIRAEAKTLEEKMALPDINVILPNFMIAKGLTPPKLEDALIDLALSFGNPPEEVPKKRKAIKEDPEGEGKKILEEEVEPIMFLISATLMTAVSLASAGLIPIPPLAAIKGVIDIIKAFEESSANAQQSEESSTVSVL